MSCEDPVKNAPMYIECETVEHHVPSGIKFLNAKEKKCGSDTIETVKTKEKKCGCDTIDTVNTKE